MMLTHRRVSWSAVLLLSAGALLAGAQSTAPLPSDLDPQSRARLPYLERKDLDENARKIFDVLPGRSKDNSTLGGPLAFAAYNPAVAKALFDLHNAAVAGVLDPRTRELAIMVACRETNYSLEWNAHEATALKVGVDAKVLDVIRNRGSLSGLDQKDAAVIRFGRQMFGDRKMDAATFAAVKQLVGPQGAMDVVAVMNTYAVSGFYAIAVDEHMPPGRADLK